MKFQSMEEVRVRAAFDDKATLTKENYLNTIGETAFPDNATGKCQLLRVKKSCPRRFQYGWLVTIQGGTEVLLGCNCAENHFDLDKFKTDSNRVAQANQLQELTDRLAAHRADENLRKRLVECETKFEAVDRNAKAIRNKLPGKVVLQLLRMAPRGSGSATYHVRYVVDEDEKGREIAEWEPRATPQIAGLALWADVAATSIANALQAARKSLAAEPVSGPLAKLKQQAADINGIEPLPEKLAAQQRAVGAFATPENLTICSLLVPDGEDRLTTVKLGLQLGKRPCGDADARRSLEQLRQTFSAAEGGRAVRF